MRLHDIKAPKGANKDRKRVGRGGGSGWGHTSGKGYKGQKARSGGYVPVWFEGGQMPLQRRLPKFGFTNIFRKQYNEINLFRFESFEGNTVNLESLMAQGYIRQVKDGVKILGKGELSKPLTFEVTQVSSGAKRKIEAAGGKVVLLAGNTDEETPEVTNEAASE